MRQVANFTSSIKPIRIAAYLKHVIQLKAREIMLAVDFKSLDYCNFYSTIGHKILYQSNPLGKFLN